jgi:hypothetical protein
MLGQVTGFADAADDASHAFFWTRAGLAFRCVTDEAPRRYRIMITSIDGREVSYVTQSWRRVRMLVHKEMDGVPVVDLATGIPVVCMKVTNLSPQREVEITHVWYQGEPGWTCWSCGCRPDCARDVTREECIPADLVAHIPKWNGRAGAAVQRQDDELMPQLECSPGGNTWPDCATGSSCPTTPPGGAMGGSAHQPTVGEASMISATQSLNSRSISHCRLSQVRWSASRSEPETLCS